jgi:hypothetical protein
MVLRLSPRGPVAFKLFQVDLFCAQSRYSGMGMKPNSPTTIKVSWTAFLACLRPLDALEYDMIASRWQRREMARASWAGRKEVCAVCQLIQYASGPAVYHHEGAAL